MWTNGATEEESDEETSEAYDTYFENQGVRASFLPSHSQLKPKFEAIFEEIQRNLPSIDDQTYDEESEELLEIFQHPMRSNLLFSDDEKDLDESMPSCDGELAADNDGPVLLSQQMQQNHRTTVENSQQTSNPASDTGTLEHYHANSVLWFDEQESCRPFLYQDSEPFVNNGGLNGSEGHRKVWPDGNGKGDHNDDNYNRLRYPSESQHNHATNGDDTNGHYSLGNEGAVPSAQTTSVKLSMNGLEDIDFDLLLQSVVEKEYRTRSRTTSTSLEDMVTVPASPLINDDSTSNIIASTAFTTKSDETDLMQRLRALSESLGGVTLHVDLHTGAALTENKGSANNSIEACRGSDVEQQAECVSRRRNQMREEEKMTVKLSSLTTTKKSMGTSTSSDIISPRAAYKSSKLKSQEEEKPTVFLDLRSNSAASDEGRRKTQLEVMQRVLVQHEPMSSSGSDNDTEGEGDTKELWFEHRRRIREGLLRGEVPSSVTANTPANMDSSEVPSRVNTSMPSNPKTQTAEIKSQSKQPHCQPLDKCRDKTEGKTGSGEQTMPLLQRVSTKVDESLAIAHPSKAQDEAVVDLKKRQPEAAADMALKARVQAEKAAQSRSRLKQQLEALRPKSSTSGKQACADATPILFDVTASYSDPIRSLMMSTKDAKECVLLTVNLSSNGAIMEHRGGVPKAIDCGHTWPASYLVLLSWLASLIPNNDRPLHGSEGHNFNDGGTSDMSSWVHHKSPFDVVGLQQMWFEGKLLLAIAVVPHDLCDESIRATTKKSKKKDGEQSAFQQIISKFLSTHSLNDVSPWLQLCQSQGIACINLEASATYTYYSPLPAISSKPLSTFVQLSLDPDSVRKVFAARIGFFWQTIDDRHEVHDSYTADAVGMVMDDNDDTILSTTQTTMVLVGHRIYEDPAALFAVFAQMLQQGFDMAGLRLAITSATPDRAAANSGAVNGQDRDTAAETALLAVAIRGTLARPVWLDQLGPADPALARRTDPNSLMALYGGNNKNTMTLSTPRNLYKEREELAIWFGGRVPDNGVINVGSDAIHRKIKEYDETKFQDATEPISFSQVSTTVAALLTATVESDVLLVLSPLLPVCCFGIIVSVCQRRGFQLRGFRRKKLSAKQASGTGMQSSTLRYFATMVMPEGTAGGSTCQPTFDNSAASSAWKTRMTRYPSAILHLRKENAPHHIMSLIECFMLQLTLQGLLDDLCKLMDDTKLCSSQLFHATPYARHILQAYVGGDFSKVPDLDSPAAPGYIAPRLHSHPELEQTVVLTLIGSKQSATFGLLLAELLDTPPHRKGAAVPKPTRRRLELLGLKWLPTLSIGQAKELTPCEAGDKEWKRSLQKLVAGPAVILCLRGIKPHDVINGLLESHSDLSRHTKQEQYEKILSPTPEMAYRLASMFFFDGELFPDNDSRQLLKYLPPVRTEAKVAAIESSRPENYASGGLRGSVNSGESADIAKTLICEESILKSMQLGPRPLATLLVVKPSGMRRNNMSRLLGTLLHGGFRIAGLRLHACSAAQAASLHNQEQPNCHIAKDRKNTDSGSALAEHIQHMTSGDSLVVCLMRENGIKRLLDILGPEDPEEARKLDPFLWRGCYGVTRTFNGFYGSTSYRKSVEDIKMFFPEGLSCKPNIDLEAEKITTTVVDGRISLNRREVDVCDAPGSTNTLVNLSHLVEVNCLLVTQPALEVDAKRYGKMAAFVDLLECLQSLSFIIVGARVILMSEDQARHYLHLVNAGSFSKVPMLTTSPSLVLAVQRDNAVTTFPYLMQSGMAKSGKQAHDLDGQMMYCKDIDTAKKTLGFFFDSLSLQARWKIVVMHH